MYSHSRRTRESRRLCAIVRGANASRLRFVRPFDFFIGRESPSILARNASSRDAKTLRNSQPSVTRQAKSPFPTRVPFRVGVGVSRSEGRWRGKVKLDPFLSKAEGSRNRSRGRSTPKLNRRRSVAAAEKSWNQIVRLILSRLALKRRKVSPGI